jgi:hypothetical protein
MTTKPKPDRLNSITHYEEERTMRKVMLETSAVKKPSPAVTERELNKALSDWERVQGKLDGDVDDDTREALETREGRLSDQVKKLMAVVIPTTGDHSDILGKYKQLSGKAWKAPKPAAAKAPKDAAAASKKRNVGKVDKPMTEDMRAWAKVRPLVDKMISAAYKADPKVTAEKCLKEAQRIIKEQLTAKKIKVAPKVDVKLINEYLKPLQGKTAQDEKYPKDKIKALQAELKKLQAEIQVAKSTVQKTIDDANAAYQQAMGKKEARAEKLRTLLNKIAPQRMIAKKTMKTAKK